MIIINCELHRDTAGWSGPEFHAGRIRTGLKPNWGTVTAPQPLHAWFSQLALCDINGHSYHVRNRRLKGEPEGGGGGSIHIVYYQFQGRHHHSRTYYPIRDSELPILFRFRHDCGKNYSPIDINAYINEVEPKPRRRSASDWIGLGGGSRLEQYNRVSRGQITRTRGPTEHTQIMGGLMKKKKKTEEFVQERQGTTSERCCRMPVPVPVMDGAPITDRSQKK
jgi:hypothetical protein